MNSLSRKRETMDDLHVDLSGEVIAVTGGGGVLCGAMAQALARNGAAVAILDIAERTAAEVARRIEDSGGNALPVVCNVLDKESILAAADRVTHQLGTPTGLVNGAGGNKREATTRPDLSFFDIPKDAVEWVFALNCMGTIMPSQVFGRLMADIGRGNIVNVSSMNAFTPLTRIPAYSAAKAAVSNFTRWLAVHMNQEYSTEIRVNAIAPGFFLTEQNRFLLTDKETGNLTPRGQQIIDHTPAGRFGDPEDLTGALLWLMSGAASFVNGVVLPIDGGFSAYSGV